MTIEQTLIARIQALDEQKQRTVLAFLDSIEDTSVEKKDYTALELLQLPPDQRNRLVQEAIEASAAEDFEIFEANSIEDFDDYTN